jgi:hypothetical protein
MRRTMIAAGNASVRWFFGSQPLMGPSSGPTPGRSSRGGSRSQRDAAELQFEVAARIRDEIKDLKHELRGMQAAGV